jgi:hypothetical protein
VICVDDRKEDQSYILNCQLYVKTLIQPHDINVYRLIVDNSIDLKVPTQTLMHGETVETDDLTLKFTSLNKEQSEMVFTLINK